MRAFRKIRARMLMLKSCWKRFGLCGAGSQRTTNGKLTVLARLMERSSGLVPACTRLAWWEERSTKEQLHLLALLSLERSAPLGLP